MRTAFISILVLSGMLGISSTHAQTNAKPAPAADATTAGVTVTDAVKPVPAPVLSFLEWKTQRVHEAQQKLEQVNKPANPAQVWQEGQSPSETTASNEKLNFNVDVALQLNVQDYFSMYLKNLSPEEFKEATKKLSPDEVTELLLAYRETSTKDKVTPPRFTKSAKDNAKGKKARL